MRHVALIGMVCLTSMAAGNALGGVPGIIPFQAVIKTAQGAIIPPNTDVSFSIWSAQSGGDRLWGPETHRVSPVDGAVSLNLGDVLPIGASVFASGGAYLAIEVGGQEMQRLRIGTSAFSFQAQSAGDTDSLGGTSAAGYSLVSHTHALHDLSDVARGTPQNGEVLTYRGGAWGPEVPSGSGNSGWVANGANLSTDAGIGNVGIGIAVPHHRLDVSGDVAASTDLLEWGQRLSDRYVALGGSGTVTTPMLAETSVTGTKVARGAITASKIAEGAVGDGALRDTIRVSSMIAGSHTSAAGVQAENSSTGSGVVGTASDWAGYGVLGTNTNVNGTGVVGLKGPGPIYQLKTGSGVTAVGDYVGLYAYATTQADSGQMGGFFSNGAGDYAMVAYRTLTGTSYKIQGTGVVSSVLKTRTRGSVALIAPESPEAWIQDYGSGEMREGAAHVELESTFLDCVTITEARPFRVFLTFTSEPPARYYVRKSTTGFDVIAADGEGIDAKFDYQVVATWRGWENVRFDPATPPSENPRLAVTAASR